MKTKLTLTSLAVTLLVALPVLQAQQTWDGDTDTTFSNGANWASGTAPTDAVTAANTATFGTTLTTFQPNLTASRSIGGLIFNKTDGGWTLSGTGNTLTLGTGGVVDNASTGTTNIAPTIAIGAARAFSTAGSTLNLNGGIQLNGNAGMSGATGTISVASISYEAAETTNTFTKSNGATVNISGAAQAGWVGAITLSAGGLRVGNNTALGGGTFNWTNSSNFGALSAVSIANNFVHGVGTHTYTGNFSITRTGTTTNSAGNRAFVNDMAAGSLLTLAGDIFLSESSGTGRTFTFNQAASPGDTLVTGAIRNFDGVGGTAGNVTVGSSAASTGIVTFAGANTYTGTTTVTGNAVLVFANTSAKAAGDVSATGGARIGLGVGGAGFFSQADVQSLFAGTLTGFTGIAPTTGVAIDTTAGNFNYSVDQGGGRSLTKLGANTLTLSGNNSYTGGTFLNAGVLAVNSNSSLGNSTGVLTFTANSTLRTTASIATTRNYAISSGVTGTIDTEANTLTHNGVISGLGGLAKVGSGTLSISGNNTYTGATNVSAGTLLINGNMSGATGAVTVASGATLGGSGTVGGNTTISGIHSPGTSPGVQNFASNLTYNSGSSVVWELVANSTSGRGTNFDGINVAGNLNFAGATTLDLSFNFAGSTVDWSDSLWSTSITGTAGWLIYDVTGTLSNFSNLSLTAANWTDGQGDLFNSVRAGNSFSFYQDGSDIYLNYTVIPEPSTWALLVIGVTGVMILRRRRMA